MLLIHNHIYAFVAGCTLGWQLLLPFAFWQLRNGLDGICKIVDRANRQWFADTSLELQTVIGMEHWLSIRFLRPRNLCSVLLKYCVCELKEFFEGGPVRAMEIYFSVPE